MNGENYKFEHNLAYLDGLVNVILLTDSEGNPIDAWKEPVSMHYFDVVLEETDTQSLSSAPLSRSFDAGAEMSVLSMRGFTEIVNPDTITVHIEDRDDPYMSIARSISGQVFEMIKDLSALNKTEAEKHFVTGLDLYLSGDFDTDRRNIIARILTAGNLISSKGRRGPAHFIMIDTKYVDYLRDANPKFPFFVMQKNDTLFGLKVFGSNELGNTVIVGRCPANNTEPGIHIITTESDISGAAVFDKGEMVGAKVTYKLCRLGASAQTSYIQFDINDEQI